MQSSPLLCYLFFPRPKDLPQQTLLRHPQFLFLPRLDRPSFTPVQTNRQNYIPVYLNLYIFGQKTARQKNLRRMRASIPCLQHALNFFLHGILICQGFSQIFGLFHYFKGFITSCCILFCMLFLSHKAQNPCPPQILNALQRNRTY